MLSTHAIDPQISYTQPLTQTALPTLSLFVFKERSVVESTSHLTEVVQQVRTELVESTIHYDELADSITAYRFHPDRLELMTGSPDRTLWDRWEWIRDDEGECPEGSLDWKEASLILPH